MADHRFAMFTDAELDLFRRCLSLYMADRLAQLSPEVFPLDDALYARAQELAFEISHLQEMRRTAEPSCTESDREPDADPDNDLPPANSIAG